MTKEDRNYVNAVWNLVHDGEIPMDVFRGLLDGKYAKAIEGRSIDMAKEDLEDDIRRREEWMDKIKKDIEYHSNEIEALQERFMEVKSEYLALKKDLENGNFC